jgi:hypothetical protein
MPTWGMPPEPPTDNRAARAAGPASGRQSRSLKYHLENNLWLGRPGFGSTKLFECTGQVLTDEPLESIPRFPKLENSPAPIPLASGMKLQALFGTALPGLLAHRLVGLLVNLRIPNNSDGHERSPLCDSRH